MSKPLSFEVAIVGSEDRFKQAQVYHHYVVTHQAQFALDMARILIAVPHKPPEDGVTNNRFMTAKEIGQRSVSVAQAVFAAMGEAGMLAELPVFADLAETQKQKTGF